MNGLKEILSGSIKIMIGIKTVMTEKLIEIQTVMSEIKNERKYQVWLK